MATHKFDRITVQSYLVKGNTSDFDITLNLASLIEAVGISSSHAVITRVPEYVANNLMNWRAISLWSSKMLCDDGLLVFVGHTTDTLPASTYINEFEFLTSTRITTTGETAFIFEKKHTKWFGAIKKRRINASGFYDISSIVTSLTRNREIVLDPFLSLRDAVIGSNRTYIGADATSKSVKDLVASMECVSPCSK